MSGNTTRSGRTYKRNASPSPLYTNKPELSRKRRVKRVPEIKSMVLIINAHGDIVVNLRDLSELDIFKEIMATGYENNFTINETFIIEDDEQDPPIEKIEGRVTYKRNDIELTPYLWTANVINVPENVNFYAVNVPCAVGYRTPNRTNPYCWKGVCREEGFAVWQDNLTNANLISEMQKLWEHYNLGLSSQRLREYYASTIHADSIRQNPSILPLPPIKKVLQKGLQTQSSDITSNIKLQIFTEEGKTTYSLLDIFDLTDEIDFPELKKDYPKCRTQINNYIDKIKYYVRISDNANLFDITLSEILQLLFSLVDKYGEPNEKEAHTADIYMVDHSCFGLSSSPSAEGQVKKDIYAKLTQYFTNRTPEQIYMGGNVIGGKKVVKQNVKKRH